MKARLAVCGAVLCLSLAASPTWRAEEEPLSAAALREHVSYLASDELAGRETGRHGIRAAEEYIARTFAELGLSPPPGHPARFIDFTLYRKGYDGRRTSLTVRVDGMVREGRAGRDFRPFPFSDEGTITAPVVFAGYGITAPEHGHDDYEGIDAEGKIVLVLRHVPREKSSPNPFDVGCRHSLFATKGANARRHGAVGMLLVTDPMNHAPGDDLRMGVALHLEPPSDRPARAFAPGESDLPGLLAAQIGRDLAESLVAPTGRSLAELQRALDAGSPASDYSLAGATASLGVRTSGNHEPVAARNVVAFLAGEDPVLRHEWIVVGAHHDHVGRFPGQGDTVFNGADDNASGVSAVLELARAFSEHPLPPRRSILFVTFSGEEKGMLGSRALVEGNLIPMDRVVFMLNLDMIGRNSGRPVQVFGDGYGHGLRTIVESANRERGLPLEFAGESYAGNSDHDAFRRAGIPFIFFFAGTHEDYHQVGDHTERLDYRRMESIVAVSQGLVDRLAGIDQLPRFVHPVPWLGAGIELLGDAEHPLGRVTSIEAGSLADRAGLRTGDEIVSLGGRSPGGARELVRRIDRVEPGGHLAVRVRRGDASLEVSVVREGERESVPLSPPQQKDGESGRGDDRAGQAVTPPLQRTEVDPLESDHG